MNSCPRLTHLSLTGVQAFLREDLEIFCRDAPPGESGPTPLGLFLANFLFPEFTEHQRAVFCVFSGQGVVGLRKYLNQERAFADMRVPPPPPGEPGLPHTSQDLNGVAILDPATPHVHADGAFDDGDPDVVDDDDGLEDGSEMIIDTQPLLHAGAGAPPAPFVSNPVHPPVPPPHAFPPLSAQAQGAASEIFGANTYYSQPSNNPGPGLADTLTHLPRHQTGTGPETQDTVMVRSPFDADSPSPIAVTGSSTTPQPGTNSTGEDVEGAGAQTPRNVTPGAA